MKHLHSAARVTAGLHSLGSRLPQFPLGSRLPQFSPEVGVRGALPSGTRSSAAPLEDLWDSGTQSRPLPFSKPQKPSHKVVSSPFFFWSAAPESPSAASRWDAPVPGGVGCPRYCVSGGATARSVRDPGECPGGRARGAPPAAARARGGPPPPPGVPEGALVGVVPRSAPAELCTLPGQRRGRQGPPPWAGLSQNSPAPGERPRAPPRATGRRGSGLNRARPPPEAARGKRVRGADPRHPRPGRRLRDPGSVRPPGSPPEPRPSAA